jgi:predicted PurR-regulated permease PerM
MEPEATPPTSADLFYARTFAVLTLLLLGFLLYLVLAPLLVPLGWALFIGLLLHPIHDWLVAKLRGRENLSAALLTLVVFLLLIGPFTALGAAFGVQTAQLLQYVQRLAGEHKELGDLMTSPVIGTVLTWLQGNFGITINQVQGWLAEGTRTVLQLLASLGGKIFLGALGTVVTFVIMMFLLFFMIRDQHEIVSTMRALIPMSPHDRNRLFAHLNSVMRAIVYGTGVTAVVQGILVAIGFAIVGLPAPIVFGAMAALFALVPMAGTPVVWAPAVIVLAVQQRWLAAGFLLGWGIVVTTLDNFLRPYLVSGRAQVHTITVFIGVLGGVLAFGALGIFLSPLLLALVIALIRFTLEGRTGDAGT